MRDAGDYDRRLLARYGGTLRACPGDYAAAQRASLAEQIRIDLAGFQALASDELPAAINAIAREEAAIAEAWQQSPAGDCAAARELGEFLMQLMHSKLQPWSGEDRFVGNLDREFEFHLPGNPKPDATPTRDVAHAVAGNFVTVVATELQLVVFPETRARLNTLADHDPDSGDAGRKP
jgi:hypothetical protein